METKVKFTELRHASELSGSEVMAIALGGTSYQMPLRLLSTFVGDDLNSPGGLINDIKSTALDNMQSIEDARREFMRLIDEARASLAEGLEDAQEGVNQARAEVSTAQAIFAEALGRVEVINDNAESSIQDVRARIDDLAALTEDHDAEIVEIAEATASLGSSVATAQSQVAALATQSQAVADSFDQLSAELSQSSAELTSRVTALADETQAVLQQNNSLVARLEDAESSILLTQRVVSLAERTSAFQNAVVQTQTAASSATIETNRQVAASDTEAVLQEVQRYEARFDESEAELLRQVNLLADADRAFGETIDTLSAEVEDNASLITLTQRVVSLAGRTSAFQNSVMQAQNAVGSAAITTDRIVSVDERRALAQQIETVKVEYEGFKASANTELTVLANADKALTQQITNVQSEYQSALSTISTEVSTLADADQAFAQQLSSQYSQFQDNLAGFESELVTLSQDDKAISQRIDTFQTEVDGNISTVQQTLSSMQHPTYGLIAQAMTTVNVGGGREGFYALNAFNKEIQFVIMADETVVYNTGSTAPAFIVRNGQIEANRALIGEANIREANIASASIGQAKIKDAAVDTLQIRGNAVTLVEDATTNNGIVINPDNGWANVQTILASRNVTGSPVSILGVAFFEVNWRIGTTLEQRLTARLYDNTNDFALTPELSLDWSPRTNEYRSAGPIVLVGRVPSNNSNRQISLQVRSYRVSGTSVNSASYVIRSRTLTVTTTKR